MKKALISPIEPVAGGLRIADVVDVAFEVAPPFYWVDVADDVNATDFYFVPGSGPAVRPAPPQPEPPTLPEPAALRVTPLQFIDRFTDEEQLAIVSATLANPAVKLWYDKLLAAQEVVFDDPRLSVGMNNLVAAGLITEARKVEILGDPATNGVTVL